ncbi:ScbA/BarX family gamma-butyrolactone biosynthesis protein [Streptomyces sp. 6-11-2]|uniref:ScbA/BarX family gamma-butyrolactone biosynthesis protein n=1 Tax=Streptomyces sp. 6-11-2 TaxID=2585753 RepID=UPI00114345D6|nr:ScbA/BarX family gamma-butyrolactone biosynthesis protein [Streptomyces sp. 6-11-2]GED83879.1 adhesin [Streptomyces sp. 6-11-2]
MDSGSRARDSRTPSTGSGDPTALSRLSPPSPPSPLNRSRTVERELVHRTSVAEVLLTDVRPHGPLSFRAAAAWPRSHPTFPRGRDDRHSPWMIVETLRQLGIYIPLRHLDVPRTARFLIDDLSYALDVAAEPTAPHGASEVTCLVQVGGLRTDRDGDALTGLRMRVDFLVGRRPFARAAGGARFLDAERYDRLRSGAGAAVPSGAGPRPEPTLLGLASESDAVVVAAGEELLVCPADPRHPFLFDHGTDHVPGTALLEAARQAIALRSGGRLVRPVACRMSALRFTEHAPPAVIHCSTQGRTGAFLFRQGGTTTAEGVLRYP